MVKEIDKLNKSIDREVKREAELDKKINEIKEILISKLKIDKYPLDQYGIDDLSKLTIKFWDDGRIAVFEKKYDNYLHRLPWEYFQDYDLWNLNRTLQDLMDINSKNQMIIHTVKSKLNID
jgi:hypothetical protein